MDTIEQLNTALRKIQHEEPFNNFRRYLAAEKLDKGLPKSLGGACVYQLKRLVKVLTGVEGEEGFVEEKGGLHTALIKREPSTGDRYYLDPFLLHKEAINLDEILRNRVVREFNVFPQLPTQAQARMAIHPIGRKGFSNTLYYNPFNPTENVSFIFNLDEMTPRHPPLTYNRLANGRPPEFTLRIFREDLSTLSLYWNTTSHTWQIKTKGGRQMQRTYKENTDDFLAAREEICTRIALPWQDLKEVVATAWQICRSLPEEEKRVF